MQETHSLRFAPFRLDLGAEQLWRGEEARPLSRKAFAALRYLVGHAGQLVTKDALIAAVWIVPYISDMALAACIREIRRALGDAAQTPQFLETVRGRGYRFCAPVTVVGAPPGLSMSEAPPPLAVPRSGLLVGREVAMARLQRCWAHAQQGTRQVVFITGETGIGKTTLVDAFVAQVESTASVWLGRGQCIEQYGAGEAYLPLLDALGHLGRSPMGARLVELLRQQAPSWLLQLPALVPEAVYDTLRQRVEGVTRERMLRELAEAVEVLTAERPLLLVLEDLHWSDAATLDWLAYVARRRQAARLLVLGTYRSMEARVHRHPVHPITQELLLHGHGVEMVVEYWPVADVRAYVARRFGALSLLGGLAEMLHRRTNGNPLFLVTVVDELVRQGVIREEPTGWTLCGGLEAVAGWVPERLQQLIECQGEQLTSEEQRLLEVASVAGVEFATATVAAGLGADVDAVEESCARLTHREQFLRVAGSDIWPDGTLTARFGFRHALYQEVFYAHVPTSRRARWHGQMGARLEAGYGDKARTLAAELAMHFVRGRDAERAVQYLRYAGMNALQRSAHQEAVAYLSQGLEVLQTLPETPEHIQDELAIQIALGTALVVTAGYAAPAVEQVYIRAYTLCQHVGDLPRSLPILRGLVEVYNVRKEFHKARDLGEQYLTRAQQTQDAELLVDAYYVLGLTLFYLGELPAARRHFEQGLELADPQRSRADAPLLDSGVACLAFLTLVLAMLGYPTQARQRSQEALTLAQTLAHPYSVACARYRIGLYQQFLGEAQAAQEQAEATITLALDRGFAFFVAVGTALKGRALSMQGYGAEGLAYIREGLAALQATGATPGAHWLVLQAEAWGHAGQPAEGLQRLAEAVAFMNTTGEQNYAAELYRLKGEFLLSCAAESPSVAETCFHQALDIARRQHAKGLELRVAMSLARLWQHQGKRTEAQQLLAAVYDWFTEGFDTASLQEAKALLEALAG